MSGGILSLVLTRAKNEKIQNQNQNTQNRFLQISDGKYYINAKQIKVKVEI